MRYADDNNITDDLFFLPFAFVLATGIARSVSPGQLIRQTAISQLSVTSPPLVGAAAPAAGGAGAAAGAIGTTPPVPAGASPDTYANTPAGKVSHRTACAK